MAMLRYGSATVAEPSISSDKWTKTICCGHKAKCACGSGSCRVKVARTILAKYSPEKYLLSHCTIIAAVDVENAPESKSEFKDYLIKPEYSKFVNNNGDAWTKRLLASTYRSFIGANNYLEHVQIPELAKGKIIDAVLRDVPVGKDKQGKDITTFYVDILVATERKHKELVRKIEAGELKTLSMGCKIAYSICTKCGNKAADESQACPCVRYEKNNVFYGSDGVQRKVAELCGHESDPDSVTFIDASWVANPAFTGAVIRNVITPPEDIMAKIQEAESKQSYQFREDDFLKAAHKTAQKDDAPPDAPADAAPPAEDDKAAPADEAPADETDEKNPDTGTPGEEAPPAPAPEEAPEEDIQTWKNQVKKKLLKELTDEIMTELEGEPGDEGGPRELETLDEDLIHPSASQAMRQMWKMKNSWDKYLTKMAGKLEKSHFDKLRFGTYMLLSSNDLTVLADYGYKKRDFLAVMSCLDNCFKKPLDVNIKKAIAILGGTHGKNPKSLIGAIEKLSGRKLKQPELRKVFTWLKLMDAYES
jgi:hypothetical protein